MPGARPVTGKAGRARPDALRNLIKNAVRYGGQARVSLEATPGGVEIKVADNGPGIPEPMRGQVFLPFFRLEASRNRQTGGVGLAIARQHGGDVALASNDPRSSGPGLVASILLPRQPAQGPRSNHARIASRLRALGRQRRPAPNAA